MLAIVAFAGLAGVLAALGHLPLAVALIAAAAAFAAVMSVGAWRRDVRGATRLAQVISETRRVQRRIARSAEKIAARDQRRAQRDEQLLERMQEMERRLLASFEAERLRAAQRHREEMDAIRSPAQRGPRVVSRAREVR